LLLQRVAGLAQRDEVRGIVRSALAARATVIDLQRPRRTARRVRTPEAVALEDVLVNAGVLVTRQRRPPLDGPSRRAATHPGALRLAALQAVTLGAQISSTRRTLSRSSCRSSSDRTRRSMSIQMRASPATSAMLRSSSSTLSGPSPPA